MTEALLILEVKFPFITSNNFSFFSFCVSLRTVADSANEGSDFIATEGTLTFAPGETEKEIGVDIVDNDIYEDDEQFLVRLSQVFGFTLSSNKSFRFERIIRSTFRPFQVDWELPARQLS